MAKIQLSADEIHGMARNMKNWANQLEAAAQRIHSLVQNMDGWNDGQYQLFLQNIGMTEQHLRQYFENMRQIARALELYADRQVEMQGNFGRDLNGIYR